ncbi:helix-turn-helix domain-containing protein [Clostridium perfringens]|uniref:helix-turn-helix domain-containing protein n=1 Tax=Clostridium perfringens TaxID=1502 RepID=UPI0024BCDCF6|nr:helix-turn-helix transcriptional regulator [Clostridium perfringens]MDU2175705.1 helix-turn-helix transcriptional regulator [Clostridioides difficile]ELC8330962.1 helix-turn-helix transcriptional regulator [Clostridium perfringens]MDU2657020.1 helix-turn-helix transcriptional regulator [Clostridium perfringens]MDU5659577.1 helix-turn-helix transcriptional regulator [Clostridium perfringens]MDU7549185.1 helix-turn-helix transcriptional regulator [Clostridium perfringens]
MKVGLRIKKIRERNGLSQLNLAKKTGYLNQSQISKIENGQRKVKVDELIILSSALNVSLTELMN